MIAIPSTFSRHVWHACKHVYIRACKHVHIRVVLYVRMTGTHMDGPGELRQNVAAATAMYVYACVIAVHTYAYHVRGTNALHARACVYTTIRIFRRTLTTFWRVSMYASVLLTGPVTPIECRWV